MTITRKRLWSILIVGLLALAIMVVLGMWQARPIRVGYLPIAAHLPLFVAQARDCFAKTEIQLVPYSSSAGILTALKNDDLDVAYEVAFDEALRFISEAPELFTIYQIGYSTREEPIDSILVPVASQAMEVSDLKGGTLATFPGQTAHIMTKLVLERSGLDVQRDVSIQPAPPPSQLIGLQHGTFVGLFAYEPTATLGVRKGIARELKRGPVEEILGLDPWVGGLGLMRTSFVKQRNEDARQFRDAIYCGFDHVRANPQSARAILPDYVKELEGADKSTLNEIRLTRHWKIDEINDDALARTITFFRNHQIIPAGSTFDLNAIVFRQR